MLQCRPLDVLALLLWRGRLLPARISSSPTSKATTTATGRPRAGLRPGAGPGTLPSQMEVTGFLGKGLVNSFYGGDDSTGTLTSPPFKIERKFINFLIGGGGIPGETCMNLLVDGKVVRTATGPNDQPGRQRAARLARRGTWATWPARRRSSRSWTRRPAAGGTSTWTTSSRATRSARPSRSGRQRGRSTIEKRYLHLP